jgi:hypothetical protein
MSQRDHYVVANETFSTRSALQKRVKEILYRYKDGQLLSDGDFEFMFELLKRHPDFELKYGVGIKAILVDQNPFYRNTRCFWLIRLDNSKTDFSYGECIKPTSQKKKFFNACRAAVEPYTQAFKRNFFDGLRGEVYFCPLTGQPLNFIGSHVDHKAPKTFQNIVENFIKEHSIDVDQVKINSSAADNEYQDTFADKDLEELWVEYHNLNADLRILSGKGNLSLSKK